MSLDLVMKYGWRKREQNRSDSSYWSLKRRDEEFDIRMPSDRVLRRLWNQVFPEKKYRPFRVLFRGKWGCIVATPKSVPLGRRSRFIELVSRNRATGEKT